MNPSEIGAAPSTRPIAVVVSLKFNPGHFSHLAATYWLLSEAGFRPYLYVHPAFNAMDEDNEFQKINDGAALKRLGPVKLAVFCFPSVRNIPAAAWLRLRHTARVIYVFHEPLQPWNRYRTAGFSNMHVAKIFAINLVNVLVLCLSHAVILPSRNALRRYEEKYLLLRRPYCHIPLMFDDEARAIVDRERKFIAYIGTIAPDHAFNRFVEFATLAMSELWFPDHRFAIVTSSDLPESTRASVQHFVAAGQLTVIAGKALSTRQINAFYARSVVVWNAYNRSMQSGVLPKAYMFGAAVISAACNGNEYVTDGITGAIVGDNADMDALRRGVLQILANQASYSAACRRVFCDTFYYHNWVATFVEKMLEKTSPRDEYV